MGKAIRASALVLLLACSAQAGWIQNESPASPPPPQPPSAVQEPTTEGDIQNDAPDSLTQTVLDLLTLLPSLL